MRSEPHLGCVWNSTPSPEAAGHGLCRSATSTLGESASTSHPCSSPESLKLLEQPGGLVLEAMALGRGGRAGEEVMRLVADRGTAWLHTEALLGRTQRHCLVAHRGTALGMMLTRLKYENVCKNAQCGTRV